MTAFSTQYNHQPEGLSNDIGPWVRFFLEKAKVQDRGRAYRSTLGEK